LRLRGAGSRTMAAGLRVMILMAEDRPAWARRMYNERKARGWSQDDAISAMRAHSARQLPGNASLLRQYKRWEAGEITPNEFYQPIIAETFGTVTHAMFPVAPRRDADGSSLLPLPDCPGPVRTRQGRPWPQGNRIRRAAW